MLLLRSHSQAGSAINSKHDDNLFLSEISTSAILVWFLRTCVLRGITDYVVTVMVLQYERMKEIIYAYSKPWQGD